MAFVLCAVLNETLWRRVFSGQSRVKMLGGVCLVCSVECVCRA